MTKQEKINSLIAEWNAVTLLNIFEMRVKNVKTGEADWIVWSVGHNKSSMIAESAELKTQRVGWDECFSLDVHLNELHEKCYEAISESKKWEHLEEE